jgi:hypothetical protein
MKATMSADTLIAVGMFSIRLLSVEHAGEIAARDFAVNVRYVMEWKGAFCEGAQGCTFKFC